MSTTLDLDAAPISKASSILYDALASVGGRSGSRGKQELLREHAANLGSETSWLFLNILKYAYDSSIRFGISADKISWPVTQPAHPIEFGSWVFTLLDEVIIEPSLAKKAALIEAKAGQLSAAGASLLTRIVGKDLRIGISEGTISKAFSSLLSKFDVMLAKPFAARHVPTWPVMIEPKLDGLRVIAEADTAAKSVQFFTRSGKPIDSLNKYKAEVHAFALQFVTDEIPNPTVAFDGEVTSGTFLESMSAVRKSSEQVSDGTFHVFDVLIRGPGHSPIALSDDELQEQGTQLQRRQRLVKGFMSLKKHIEKPEFVKLTESYVAGSEEEVFTLYGRFRNAKLEGAIVKDPGAFYVKKRSAAWMKLKAQETADLPIIGAFEGTGKYAGMLGGLIVLNGEVEVRVGSGFSDDQRRDYWAQMQEDLRYVESDNREKCVLIDCPAEIEYQEQLPSGSLRHPVFVRLRRDKQLGAVGMF